MALSLSAGRRIDIQRNPHPTALKRQLYKCGYLLTGDTEGHNQSTIERTTCLSGLRQRLAEAGDEAERLRRLSRQVLG